MKKVIMLLTMASVSLLQAGSPEKNYVKHVTPLEETIRAFKQDTAEVPQVKLSQKTLDQLRIILKLLERERTVADNYPLK